MNDRYNRFAELEKFNPDDHPIIVAEIEALLASLDDSSFSHKREIVISYLKNCSIKTDWIKANPKLAALMVSGTLNTPNLEAIFASPKVNKVFAHDLEEYLKRKLN